MKQFPFTDYDFWSYLTAGFLLLFTLDYCFSANLLIKREYTVAEAILAGSVAYVLGHIIAGLSSAILEKRFSKWFGSPVKHLLGTGKVPRWGAFVYPSYFEKTALGTLAAISKKRLINEDDFSLFQRAHRMTLKEAKSADRLASFLNQYGFCRNVSFASACAGSALLICWQYTDKPHSAIFCAIAFAISVGMYFRYLKYNRLFVNEVFATFAFIEES